MEPTWSSVARSRAEAEGVGAGDAAELKILVRERARPRAGRGGDRHEQLVGELVEDLAELEGAAEAFAAGAEVRPSSRSSPASVEVPRPAIAAAATPGGSC